MYSNENGIDRAMESMQGRPPAISSELARLEKNIIVLSEVIGTLENRLECALSPRRAPSPVPNDATKPEPVAPLAASLAGYADKVHEICGRATDILQRLDL